MYKVKVGRGKGMGLMNRIGILKGDIIRGIWLLVVFV